MSYDALRDLDLAGVQWELADVPIAIPRPKITSLNTGIDGMVACFIV